MPNTTIDWPTFSQLPTSEVADLVRANGPKVVVFPINGTRRWFMLEHGLKLGKPLDALYDVYQQVTAQRYVEVLDLIFEHGIETLVSPAFGGELAKRGTEYMHMVTNSLTWLADYPAFTQFYTARQVRVRFYGDYAKTFTDDFGQTLQAAFSQATHRTQMHRTHRLFWGVCANDATETVVEWAVQFAARHGRAPNRREVIEMYYGEYIEAVNMFVGFDKLSVFDMPLITSGEEDLYFTVCPSLYLTSQQFRRILYDHLYTRCQPESQEWSAMRAFYQINMGNTLGVGEQRQGFWYPTSEVNVPANF